MRHGAWTHQVFNETCDSKNGKRVRGISAKDRLSLLESKLALYSSPCPRSFHLLIRKSTNKVSSAVRKLALLGSTQLAPGGPREAREAKKKPERFPQNLKRASPRDAPEEPSQKQQKNAPEMHQKIKEKLTRDALTEAAKEAPADPPERPKRGPIWGPLIVSKCMVFYLCYSKNENLCYHGTGSEESAREYIFMCVFLYVEIWHAK